MQSLEPNGGGGIRFGSTWTWMEQLLTVALPDVCKKKRKQILSQLVAKNVEP